MSRATTAVAEISLRLYIRQAVVYRVQ